MPRDGLVGGIVRLIIGLALLWLVAGFVLGAYSGCTSGDGWSRLEIVESRGVISLCLDGHGFDLEKMAETTGCAPDARRLFPQGWGSDESWLKRIASRLLIGGFTLGEKVTETNPSRTPTHWLQQAAVLVLADCQAKETDGTWVPLYRVGPAEPALSSLADIIKQQAASDGDGELLELDIERAIEVRNRIIQDGTHEVRAIQGGTCRVISLGR